MANHLKMATVHTIYTLLERGWSHRRIARTLGIDRETVARYARLICVMPGAESGLQHWMQDPGGVGVITYGESVRRGVVWWQRNRTNSRPGDVEASQILKKHQFAMSANGVLEVRPVGPTLSYREFHGLLDCFLLEGIGDQLKELVFDFSSVEVIQSPWTVVLALLIDLVRKTGARCRIRCLRAQPEAIVKSYRLDQALRSLFDNGELSEPMKQETQVSSELTIPKPVEA